MRTAQLQPAGIDDADRETFGDRGLADAGFANQHRVVLGAAAQHLDGAANFFVATDDRVELAVTHRLRQVARILLQRIVLRLGRSGIGSAALADGFDRLVQGTRGDAGRRQDLARIGVLVDHQRQQQPLDRHERVAGLLCRAFGGVEDARHFAAEIDLAVAGDDGNFLERGFDAGAHRLAVAAGAVDQPGAEPLVVVH